MTRKAHFVGRISLDIDLLVFRAVKRKSNPAAVSTLPKAFGAGAGQLATQSATWFSSGSNNLNSATTPAQSAFCGSANSANRRFFGPARLHLNSATLPVVS